MNKNKKFIILGILGFITVITVQLLVRMVFISDLQFEINLAAVSDHYYDPAYISDSGLIFSDYTSVRGLYLVLLSCAFKFFGNLDAVIIFYNAVLELLALIFIYFAIRNIFGRICAFIISLLVAVYPAAVILSGTLTGTIYMPMWRDDRLLYLAGAIGLWIISLIISAIKKSVKAKKIQAASSEESADAEQSDISAESDETDGAVITSDGLKEDEIEIIDNGEDEKAENVIEAKETSTEICEEEPADIDDSHVAVAKEEDLSKPYPADASLQVVLTDDGMIVVGPNRVELLKNPLPGPKKHEHKDMDYDYDIDPSQMKYDIDTDDVSEYDYE